MPDPAAVNTMFARIARRYDVANRVLTGGIDLWWRHRLVSTALREPASRVLDLATGSGDVAFALSRRLPAGSEIVGMDFCQPMLDEAVLKQNARTPFPNIRFQQGDALALPFPEAYFDAVTLSFGLRNMVDRARALKEIQRVLRPGGALFLLEFSQPYGWFRPFYYFYLSRVLPTLAGAVTGDRAAYEYLNTSIAQYPGHLAMSGELQAAGFGEVTVQRLTGGIVALHAAGKMPVE